MNLKRQTLPRILALMFVAALMVPSTLLMTSCKARDSGALMESPLFTFVQITDARIHDAASAQAVSQAAQDMAELPSAPAFVINTGDIVDHPSDALFDLYSQQIMSFACPVYSAIGDHDDAEDPSKTLYGNHLGSRNYAFDVGPYHFIVLDSTKPDSLTTLGGGFEADTFTWLSDHLKSVDHTKPIIVFTHHAFWSPFAYDPQNNLFCDVENPTDAINLFAGYNLVAVFSGHAHSNMQYTEPSTGITFHISGALGLGIQNQDQSAAGYTIVECYSDRIETYYVPLGQIDQYYIYPRTNVVTVAQHGTGDYRGTTQDSIQQAINYLHSKGGGTVLIKPGKYILTGTDSTAYYGSITMYDNIWLKGVGNPVLKFCDGSVNKRAITCTDCVHNVRIQDLTIDCNMARSAPGTDHTWYNAIEMDGAWAESYAPADSNMVKDVVIEGCTIINSPSRGIVSYAGRRWSVRNCHFNNVYGPISPDHWTDFWQIEGNNVTACGVGIELNDTANSMIFNNTIDGASTEGMDLWAYTTIDDPNGMPGNALIDNRVSNVIGGYGIDVHVLNADHCEIIGNVLDNVAGKGIAAPYYASTPALGSDWVLANNTYNNVAAPESYYGVWLTAPTSLQFTSITSNSITVKAVGATSSSGSLQYNFQAREYSQPGRFPNTLSSGTITSDTYTFTNLVQNHVYAFRCSAKTSTASAWTEWYFSDESYNP